MADWAQDSIAPFVFVFIITAMPFRFWLERCSVLIVRVTLDDQYLSEKVLCRDEFQLNIAKMERHKYSLGNGRRRRAQ